jgi:hypothetical protein
MPPAVAAEDAKEEAGLLAVRSLEVTPMTDEELDQVVGAQLLTLIFDFGPLALGPILGTDISIIARVALGFDLTTGLEIQGAIFGVFTPEFPITLPPITGVP